MKGKYKEAKRYFKFNMKFRTKIGSFFNYSGPGMWSNVVGK